MQEIKEDIRKLSESIFDIQNNADRENRDLTAEETSLIQEMKGCIDAKSKMLPQASLTVPGGNLMGGGGGGVGSHSGTRRTVSTDSGGFENIGEIMSALYRKSCGEGYDPRLKALQIKAATEIGSTVPSEGGFALPAMFTEHLLSDNLMDTVLLQLCDRQIMTQNNMSLPAFFDNNHSATAPFGITWSQIAEGASFGSTQGTPFRSMALSAKKSGALFLVNNEWLADSSMGVRQRLENIWQASLRWYVENLLWAGTGAGQCLGALVGDGAVSIPIESGQAVQTILTENVVNMWSRLRPGSHNRAIFVCNASVFPSLATLSLSVGTGGAPTGLLQTNAGIAGAPATSIFGRPLYMSEHLPSIGNSGDLVLLDPLLYLLADRQQITLDVSPHLKFDTDQTVFRASVRLDAQPVYESPLTPKNGDTCGWLLKIDNRI